MRLSKVTSLDVRVLGVAGGSMIRLSKNKVEDVGPRSAHIAGLDYAAFTPAEEIVDPKLELFSPRPGDPSDYVAIRLAGGKRITITNTCAANVLGLVTKKDYSYGDPEACRKAMQPVADYLGTTVEDVATQILTRAYEKIAPVILELADKYKLEHDQISLVGVGGGATSLIGFCADKMNVPYRVPENAEVISSIGVALAMVRDVVERVVPNPTPEDIRSIKREAVDKAVESGASADTVEVHIEIDSQTSKITAIATGSTEVKTQDLMAAVTEKEAFEIAAKDLRTEPDQVQLLAKNNNFYVFQHEMNGKNAIRIIDRKGFIKVQRGEGTAMITKAASYRDVIATMWEGEAVYTADAILRPDYYICAGARVMDFSGSGDLNQMLMLIEVEMSAVDPNEEIIIVAARAQI